MNIRKKCSECGACGSDLHIMCHGYWDEYNQEMAVWSEVDGIDWFCDDCGAEVEIEEEMVEEDAE